MTSIQGAGDVALFIRRQLETMRATPTQRLPGAGKVSSEGPDRAAQNKDLPSLVFRRIRLIDPVDPDRRRKVFSVFIESVLLFELGDELINDPKFHELVAHVQARMSEDAALARSMDEAADRLVDMLTHGD